MKKTLLFLLLPFAIQWNTHAQTIPVESSQKIVGTVFATGEKISANEYRFPMRIHKIDYDTVSGTRKKDEDVLQGIDLSDGKVLWEREIEGKYGWNELFYRNDSILILLASGFLIL